MICKNTLRVEAFAEVLPLTDMILNIAGFIKLLLFVNVYSDMTWHLQRGVMLVQYLASYAWERAEGENSV